MKRWDKYLLLFVSHRRMLRESAKSLSHSQLSHQHGEGTKVLSIDRQVLLLQHAPLAGNSLIVLILSAAMTGRWRPHGLLAWLDGTLQTMTNKDQLSPSGPPPLHRYYTSKVKKLKTYVNEHHLLGILGLANYVYTQWTVAMISNFSWVTGVIRRL